MPQIRIQTALRSLSQPTLLAAVALLASCASDRVERSPAQQVGDLIGHGEFAKAVELAAQFAEEDPVSEEYEALHQQSSVAYLLEKGRRATFEDDDRLAIQCFEEALALDSEHALAKQWLSKTRVKLATRLTDEGTELAGNNEFQEAWKYYTDATAVLPDFPNALRGMENLDRQIGHRETMGREYYDQGVSALVAKEYAIAANRFGYVRKYRDEDDRLKRRSAQVDLERSREHQKWAEKLEMEGLFYAARAEFQQAVLIQPGNLAAREGSLRCAKEADVSDQMNRGQSALVRGEFIRAEIAFNDALENTLRQRTEIEGLIQELETARLQARYDEAVHLENDLRFEEAIVIYEDLLMQEPEFSDAQARQAALKTRVQKAIAAYASLAGEKTDVEKLTILKEVEGLFPDFRDVPERIARLENKGVRLPSPQDQPSVE